jgi:hypothetical protein
MTRNLTKTRTAESGASAANRLCRFPTPLALRAATSPVIAILLLLFMAAASSAQEPIPDGPPSGPPIPSAEVHKSASPGSKNTTVVERAGGGKGAGALKLVALLTADGQQIDQGLVWRVFLTSGPGGKSKLVSESHDASPSMKLPPGEYTVNAAFGRANLTRKIVVKPGSPPYEAFVLNAGGLRLAALVGGKPAPPGSVTYAIFSDDRDQFDSRTAVMAGAKPNLIIRLNSGIYRIVSQYGDANAKIETDVTVEAGKLTETTVAHSGGKATFKLVTRQGGEAMPDTRWTVQTSEGEVVKESVGALPTHVLSPGKYVVTASSGGHLFKNSFEIKDGDVVNVEVLMTAANEDRDAAGSTDVAPSVDVKGAPSLDFRNP